MLFDKTRSVATILAALCVASPNGAATNQTDVITETLVNVTTSTTALPPTTAETASVATSNVTTQAPPSTTQRPVDVNCLPLPLMGHLDHLTQEEFTSKLTDSCRYDRLIKPVTSEPLQVEMQMDLIHVESSDAQQMTAFILVQLSYRDNRLQYDTISPARGNIQGEEPLRNQIWVPHLTVKNERSSALMGLDGKDVFVQITPSGRVTYSYRMSVTFYCWMNLQKFPFDYQTCEINWVSWSYDASNLKLGWTSVHPVEIARNLHLTEFVLDSYWTRDVVMPASFSTGGLAGNYSCLIFQFKLRREVGYYVMDFFLPSMFLVVTSWVGFWLQADASAPRAVIGTSTMLSLITLNGGVTKNLPKVSYVKASEIWFLGCSVFIFCSLAEFAFVNVIWRRRKHVEVKKPSGKYILRGAVTPSLARKQLRRCGSANSIYKARSCSSLEGPEPDRQYAHNNYLTVHDFSSMHARNRNSRDDLIDSEETVTTIPVPEIPERQQEAPGHAWTTMTPQEVANWIDRRSRIFFPVTFALFNLFYWSFVYAL
ncbi:pH-sensitive chloride channel 2-like [Cylas formicarius]|uniref:pH-sensitive chloride channel 2-like n=1 Tax=Cylas formicarius TaxID=197179 RepID=UPI0029589397|nr:pH-sensitive chloride channel 2-like [Cylas formicarius]